MNDSVAVVKELFVEEKNGTRYMFRLLGLQLVRVWGFNTTKTVRFTITNRAMRNTLIQNKVIKYTKATINKETGERYAERLGLTQLGWSMWLNDAKKYGYGLPEEMFAPTDAPSQLEDMPMYESKTLAEQIADITIKLQSYKDVKAKPVQANYQNVQGFKSAMTSWTAQYEVRFIERQKLVDEQNALIQTLQEAREKRSSEQMKNQLLQEVGA